MESYLLKHINHPTLFSIKTYLELGGYQALKKVINHYTPQEIISQINDSNLRGRGGGWYPTGKKWLSLQNPENKQVYFCCNVAEGEPGSFKDRLIIEQNPHLFIEGMIIAAYALGVNQAYIYLRGEFVQAMEILNQAFVEAEKHNFIGNNILNSDFSLKKILFRSGGNYICGEETALINSLEGWAAVPREKPPYPAECGLYGSPTIVNNAETIANIPHIILNGIDWFKALGDRNCPGNMLFSLSGNVKKPAVYELPIGILTLREIIYDVAGGITNDCLIKAVIPGGGSSGFLKENELDILMHPDSLKTIGSSLGTGSIIVMNEQVDIVEITRKLAQFFKAESCKNECDICKRGTSQLYFHLHTIEMGLGTETNWNKLNEVIKEMKDGGICGMPQISSSTINSALIRFSDEFKNRIIK